MNNISTKIQANLKSTFGFIVCLLLFFSCKNNEVFDLSTSEKFEIQKEKTARQNIKNDKLSNGFYQTTIGEISIERRYAKFSEAFAIDPMPILFTQNCKKLQEVKDRQNTEVVRLLLDPRGAKEWASATQRNIGKQLVLILDNKIAGVIQVSNVVTDGVVTFKIHDLTEKNIAKMKAMVNVQYE